MTATTGRAAAGFLRDLVDQVRAGDPYGRFDRFSDEHLLQPFLTGRSVLGGAQATVDEGESCTVDPAVEGRLRCFYGAVAAGVERAGGVMTGYLLDLSHEGFGRAVVLAGNLVAVGEVLRDVQRFGFPSLTALDERGQGLVRGGAERVAAFPEVAHADD